MFFQYVSYLKPFAALISDSELLWTLRNSK